MLDYLTKYGLSMNSSEFEDIDVIDKMSIETQINKARKRYHDLLKLMDGIDEEILENQYKISMKSKFIIQKAKTDGVRPNELYSTDDEYIEYEFKRDALRTGKEMVAAQINFAQSDLRILNSTFYNKF